MRVILALLVVVFLFGVFACEKQEPPKNYLNESQVEKDARMEWFREARFGMFIHWGLYAIPAGEYNGEKVKGIGEWIHGESRYSS